MIRLSSILAFLLIAFLPAQAQIAKTADQTKSLNKGDKAPAAKIVSGDGEATTLVELAKEKPVVLVFYRGHWCPLCMRHLKQFNNAVEDVKKAGYQLVAIAPDGHENVAETKKKLGLDYAVYSDPDNKLAQGFGIAFKDRKNRTLPTPAVYAIAADGTLQYAHADANYRKRLLPATLVEALKK